MYAVELHWSEHVLLLRYPLVQLRQLVFVRQVLHGGIHAVQLLLLESGKKPEGHVELHAPL